MPIDREALGAASPGGHAFFRESTAGLIQIKFMPGWRKYL